MIGLRRILRDEQGRIRRNDTGSALVIALVFLTLFGVLVAILLSFAGTGFQYTLALRGQNQSIYGADGAIEGAIDFLRYQLLEGRAGKPCTTFGPMEIEGKQVTVLCDGLSLSGDSHIPNFDETLPEQAILALTQGPETGISQGSNNIVRIKGNVWTNNNIVVNVQNARLRVQGSVTAAKGCDNASNIEVTVDLVCSTSTTRADPNYPMLVTTPPPPGVLPSCGAGTLVTVPPGTYRDAVALSNLTNFNGACKNKLIWFQPGVYYFDFPDTDAQRTWTISGDATVTDGNVDVVAGTPDGWETSTVTPGNRPSFKGTDGKGSCETEADIPVVEGSNNVPPNLGVQFIFGANSSIDISGAEVEFCSQPSPRPPDTSQQQIAIFGVTQTTGAPGAQTSTVTNPSSAASPNPATPDDAPFAPTSTALTINGAVAQANLSSATPRGSIHLTGYCTPACIPSGSVINDVVLRVAHKEDRTGQNHLVGNITATVQWNSGTATAFSGGGGLTLRHNQLTPDEVDLDSKGLDTLDELNNGVTVTYEALRQSGSPTAELDGIEIKVTYTPPATGFRSQSGNLITGDSRSFFRSSGNLTGLAVYGTIYAPLSGVEINLNHLSQEAITRGVIARYVRLFSTASTEFEGFPVSLPDGARANRKVLLRAVIDGRVRVRAVVEFNDGCSDPVDLDCRPVPGKTAKVVSWSYAGA